MFVDHTVESAPPAARRTLTATESRLGYLPAAMARMAESPQLLDGFLKLSGLFESTSLDPPARETLILTIATRNGCHVCVAMHTARLVALSAPPELITALREGRPLDDPRLEALRRFTVDVVESAGGWTRTASRSSCRTASPGSRRWRWCWGSAHTHCPQWPTGSRTPRWTSRSRSTPGPGWPPPGDPAAAPAQGCCAGARSRLVDPGDRSTVATVDRHHAATRAHRGPAASGARPC
jgi:AhpD family alkylhydroperoxidase